MPAPTISAVQPATEGARARRRKLPLAALGLVALFLAFGAGVLHLLHLRFDVGDVYPPYSTLRSDPLGTKVLYESLRELPHLSVERSLRPLHSMGVPVMSPPGADHGEAGFVCFCLGADPADWPYLFSSGDRRRLDDITARGGRIVLTFQPTTHVPNRSALTHARELYNESRESEKKDDEAQADPKNAKGKDEGRTGKDRNKSRGARRERAPERADLVADWQIDFLRQGEEKSDHDTDDAPMPWSGLGKARSDEARPVRPYGPPQPAPAPGAVVEEDPPVPWHTVLDFRVDTPEARRAGWRTLYARAGRAVVVARHVGTQGGELVLVSDSFFLSNEGLHDAAHAELLATLVGPGRRVLFDESHLGIAEHPGIMTLARRYRLQGALAALGLLAGLFVWRNSVSLLPARTIGDDPAEGGSSGPVTGRDAAAGFLNLLRRGVGPAQLSALCVAQWQQHLSPATGPSADARHLATPENVGRAREVLATAGRQPPAALYRTICARLRQRDRQKGAEQG